MSVHTETDFVCGEMLGRTVLAQASEQQLTSDSGLLLFGQFDEKIGMTKQFAQLVSDTRVDPQHSVHSIICQRVFGILAGYEDQNDHDTLRSDPIFKLLARRSPNQNDLASQPTISRLENAVTPGDLLKMEQWFIQSFVDSFKHPPKQITLDIDTYDDQAHGQQQLTLWHDYYKQNQYQVRVLTCAETDQIVLPGLLFGSAHVALGAADEISEVIKAIRCRFPQVKIHLRADSGFEGDRTYRMIESFENATYSIGMKINAKTKRLSEKLLEETIEAKKSSGNDEVRYLSVVDYTSKKWDCQRKVVIKCEATSHSTSRRVVISNCDEVLSDPGSVYRGYAGRGESENRNKELKCGLFGDRLSDHRYMANLFRLMMHCVSHNLLVSLRRLVELETEGQEAASVLIDLQSQVDQEKAEQENTTLKTTRLQRQIHNERRRQNVLAQGHPCTWRTHVIKVASRVICSTRRIVLQISASWPHLKYFLAVSRAIERYDRGVT